MKTKFSVIASAILMGTALSASATPPEAPKYPFYNPNLFAGEKGAYAALEGAMQEGEAFVYSTGCPVTPRQFDIKVLVDETGTGSVDVSAGGVTQFVLNVKPGPVPLVPVGSRYDVTGFPTNHIYGNALPYFSATARYSAGGAMMTQGATLGSKTVNNGTEALSGLIIKDFYKVNPTGFVPVIYDWGLQSMHKNTIPQDKWWQRSVATRSDNQIGKTVWWKERIFSAKTMSRNTCKIEITMAGSNDFDGFFQEGTYVIKR